jgi:hypothetical protein
MPFSLKNFISGGPKVQYAKKKQQDLESKRAGRLATGKQFKEKDRQALEGVSAIQNKHRQKLVRASMLSILGATALVVATAKTFHILSRPAQTKTTQTIPFQVSGNAKEAIRRNRDQVTKALQLYQEHPRIREILEVIKNKTVFAVMDYAPEGARSMRFLSSEEQEQAVRREKFVLLMIPPGVQDLGGAVARVSDSRNRMEIVLDEIPIEYLGQMLGHEMGHVLDILEERKQGKKSEESIAMSEVRSYLFEKELLELKAPEQLRAVLDEGTTLLLNKDYDGFILVLEKYFDLQKVDPGFRQGIHASFMLITLFEYHITKGATMEELGDVYIEYRNGNRRKRR